MSKILFVPPAPLILPGPGPGPDGWGLPPNLGVGFTQLYPTYDGSVLPNLTFGSTANIYGMNAAATQAKGLSIVPEPLNPTGSGLMLRMTFPGKNDPFWNEVFPYSVGGGRSPYARFNMAAALAPRNLTEIHFRMCCRWNAGWTETGPSTAPPTQYDVISASANTQGTITVLGNPGWATNEHVGRYFTTPLVDGTVFRILGNTSNVLQVPDNPQHGLPYNTFAKSSAITTLSTGISSGVSSLPVVSTANFAVGHVLRIGQGANRETVTIQSIPVSPPNTLVLTGATLFAHSSGDSVARVSGYIITGNATGPVGVNAGVKLWFPQLEVTASGSGVVHGQAWSRNQTYIGAENNFFGGWTSNSSHPLLGYPHPYIAPQIHDWDGVTTDGQGAIGTNGAITFGVKDYFAPPPPADFAFIPTGVIYDAEFYLKLSTPGNADGLVKVWINGSHTPVYNRTDFRFMPTWMHDTVSVGGVNYTVPVLVSAGRVRALWSDMTFGGGLKIPNTTEYFDILAIQSFGK